MKVIWYEDLVANFDEEVKGLSEFTGFKLSDDNMAVIIIISSSFYHINEQNSYILFLTQKNHHDKLEFLHKVLKEHMKIDNMRKNIRFGINNERSLVRKGGAGGWKKYFTNESTLKKFDAWIQKNNVDEFGKAIEGLRFE